MFWESHNVTATPWGRQYMSAIWYHDEDQKKAILRSQEKCQKRLNASKGQDVPIQTKVDSFKEWTNAEDYHQKFYLRKHDELVKALACASEADLRESPIAARLNSYVASHGSIEQLDREIDTFALDEESKAYLRNIVRNKKRGFFCAG